MLNMHLKVCYLLAIPCEHSLGTVEGGQLANYALFMMEVMKTMVYVMFRETNSKFIQSRSGTDSNQKHITSHYLWKKQKIRYSCPLQFLLFSYVIIKLLWTVGWWRSTINLTICPIWHPMVILSSTTSYRLEIKIEQLKGKDDDDVFDVDKFSALGR